MKYKRILLKLSGEALGGPHSKGFDKDSLAHFAREIASVHRLGCQTAVVLGGGNIFRGARNEGLEIDRVSGDYMGMLATLINSMALGDELKRQGIPSLLLSGLAVDRLCMHPTRERMLEALEQGKVLLLAGGTGNPFFTTDSAAALRAAEIGAGALLKGTRVDGVYSADPEKDPSARRYPRLSFDQALNEDLRIMDPTAFTLCRENNIPILVFKVTEPGTLSALVQGEERGSLVHP
ncbi:MAG TPA: UMP kinase [Bacteroidales bacterium]|nr:UMP kinase [Bacteroidales bacterium]HRZ77996.1 UMP kinase [Bacteroidales bacterium]